MLAHRAAGVAALLLTLLPGPRAHACDCGTPGFQLWPTQVETAPRNTHVWVLIPPSGEPAWDPNALELRREGRDPAPAAKAKPKKGKKSKPAPPPPDLRIKLTRKVLHAGDSLWVELIPDEPLPAMSRVELVYTMAGSRIPLGIVRVGNVLDETPPAPTPPMIARWVPSGQMDSDCSTGRAHLRLELPADPEPLLYAVWLADAAPDAPPSALGVARGGVLTLGAASTCLPGNMTLGDTPPSGLVVRAVNRAGLLGEPRSIKLAPVGAARHSDAVTKKPATRSPAATKHAEPTPPPPKQDAPTPPGRGPAASQSPDAGAPDASQKH